MDNRMIALFLFILLISFGCVSRFAPGGGACTVPGDSCDQALIDLGLEPPCCPGTECISNPLSEPTRCHYTLMSYWSSWITLALLAILISAFIVALAYMIAYLLSNQMLLAWAKSEFFQVIASAVIVGSIMGVLFLMQQTIASEINAAGAASGVPFDLCDAATVSPSGIPNCHILLAHEYMQVMYDDAGELANSILVTNTVFTLLRGLSLGVELFAPPYFGINVVPLAGLGIPAETLTTALDAVLKIMMVMKMQQLLLNYIESTLFPVLMIMGLVLRSFFFTRKLGGLLIAIAVGLYLVYPLIYVLAHNIWLNTIYKDRALSTSYNTNIDSYLLFSYVDEDLMNVVHPELAVGETLFDRLIKMRVNSGGLYNSILPYINGDFIIGDGGYLEKTGVMLVYATFIPFIALMVTIGFVRGLSIALGGDVEIAGLTKFI
ncbi:MAG: hypothetical protein ABIG39_02115 [Candidatus Micrarchaeota archaeon]